MEALSKLLELIKQLVPFITGFFIAKQDSKIDKLEEEVETLKEFDKIDNTIVNNVYDSGMFSK
jgi:hypothetical protein